MLRNILCLSALIAVAPAAAGGAVAQPGDPQWPFWAEHAKVLTARKAPQTWVCPARDADEIAYVYDVKGARFVDGDPDDNGITHAYRRGVSIASPEHAPLRIRYRARAGATPLIVYWAVLTP